MFFISKNSLFQLMRTLRWRLSLSFLKNELPVGQFKYGNSSVLLYVKIITVFVTRMQ